MWKEGVGERMGVGHVGWGVWDGECGMGSVG